jgi:uncharacterized protein YegP (UPF0339 family)
MGKFQLFQGKNSQYYFRLLATNGQIILASEGYTSKTGCTGGIESVKKNAPLDARYARKDGEGSFSFTLKAANGEVIGRSESYTTKAAREGGIESVKKNAPTAFIEEV